jgi:hypothetical protein
MSSPKSPGASTQAEAKVAGLSALDQMTPIRPRQAGAMTLLRNDLLTEESSKQKGWLENLLPRPVKTTPGQMPSRPDQGQVAPNEMAIGSLSSSERPAAARVSDGLPGPAPTVVDSEPAPLVQETVASNHQESAGPRGLIPWALAVITVSATSTMALLPGNGAWSGVLWFLTIGLLGISIFGILHRRRARKAFWEGFAVFGCGYFVLTLASSIPQQIGVELPSSRLARFAHAKMITPRTGSLDSPAMSSVATAVAEAPPATVEVNEPIKELTSPLPIAGDLKDFLIVGHCAFTLLAALIGSAIAHWFYRSNTAFA